MHRIHDYTNPPPLKTPPLSSPPPLFFVWQAKIDVVLDKALNVIFKPASIAGRVAKRMTKAQKIACGGSAAAVSTAVGGGVSVALMAFAVPVVFMALLFLPLTLMGGVSVDGRNKVLVCGGVFFLASSLCECHRWWSWWCWCCVFAGAPTSQANSNS